MSISFAAFAREEVVDTIGVRTAAAGNPVELLRGKISSVRVSSIDGNPVGALNVNIRGINSVRTDNQPLWIVDGVMVSTQLNENLDAFWQYGETNYTAPLNPLACLNAAEIESIEVLKDISATAVYGARGANGVIIVNTRKSSALERDVRWRSDFGIATDASSLGLAPALNMNHIASFSGSGNNTSYNISAAFREIRGTVPGNGSRYGSVKANFDTHANKALWFGLDAIMGIGESSSPTGVAYLGRPSMTLALRDASFSPGTTPEKWASDYDDDTQDYRALVSAWLRLNFSKSLSLKVSAGMDFQDNLRIIWYGRGTDFGAMSVDNQYGGAAANLKSQLLGFNASAVLSFNRYFGTDHHVSAVAGIETLGNLNRFNTLNGINFVSQQLRGRGLKVGAYETTIHTFRHDWFHLGGWLSVNYDYRGLAGVKLTCRTDDTPTYLGQESGLFPSAEVFADLGKILLPQNSVVGSLKIKGGAGISGKEQYIPYDLFGNYLSGSWYVPEAGTTAFYDGLARLRTSEWHVGAEATLLDGRFHASLTWFDRHTDDTFVMYRLGHEAQSGFKNWIWDGCEQVFTRSSGIRNRGYEIDLDGTILKSGKFSWSASLNLANIANNVVSYDPEDFHGRKVGNGIFCTCNGQNLPVSCLYGYRTDDSGVIVDITRDGRIDEADMVLLGKTIPSLSGGFMTALNYGPLSFEILLDGASGHQIANLETLVQNGVKGPDGVTVLTSDFVENGDWLRIADICAKYVVTVRKSWLSGLEFRAGIHNVATLSSYSGWSADVNCFGVSTLANGMDYGSYPVARSFLLGVTAKF